MKILLAGDWHSSIHEEACSNALEQLGNEVIRFPWYTYFDSGSTSSAASQWARRAQNKYLAGPILTQINRDFVNLAARNEPELLFVYRGTHIFGKSLKTVRSKVSQISMVGYNNDDPFAPGRGRRQWRHFINSIPEYDVMFAYRQRNLADFRKAGAKATELLMPWFSAGVHKPVTLTPEEHLLYDTDVVFIGHYEDDERVPFLRAIAQAGLRLRIFGPEQGWGKAIAKIPELRSQLPIHAVRGAEYVKAICGSKVALSFLSKINRDGYTRRSFEIPATGTAMLSSYTPELANLFSEDVEVAFFRNSGELVEKASYYVKADKERTLLAERGLARVVADEHDVVSRMRWMLAIVNGEKARR